MAVFLPGDGDPALPVVHQRGDPAVGDRRGAADAQCRRAGQPPDDLFPPVAEQKLSSAGARASISMRVAPASSASSSSSLTAARSGN
jgi:hypothetical protein